MPNQSRFSCINGGLRKLPTFADVAKNGANNNTTKNDNTSRRDKSAARIMPRVLKPDTTLSASTSASTSAGSSPTNEWRIQERKGKRYPKNSDTNLAHRYSPPRTAATTSYPSAQLNGNTSRNIGINNNNDGYHNSFYTNSCADRSIERVRNGILKDFIIQKPEVGVIFTQRTSDYYRRAYRLTENSVWSDVVKGNNRTSPESTFSIFNSNTDPAANYNRDDSDENQSSQNTIYKRVQKNRNGKRKNNENFERNNPEWQNPMDSASPSPLTYTFGDFDRTEVASSNSMVVIRTPRRPPASSSREQNRSNDDHDGQQQQQQSFRNSISIGNTNTIRSAERPTLEYRLEQQIRKLKTQSLTVNQLYIVDLIEDLLLKYQADAYGKNGGSISRTNGFSNNLNNIADDYAGNSDDVIQSHPVLEEAERLGNDALPQEKISSTTIVLETVEQKRERSNRRAKLAQSNLDSNGNGRVAIADVEGNGNRCHQQTEGVSQSNQGNRSGAGSGGGIVLEQIFDELDVGTHDENKGDILVRTDAGVDYGKSKNEATYTQRWNHIDECGNIVVGTINPEYQSEWENMEITEIFRKSGRRESISEERNNKN